MKRLAYTFVIAILALTLISACDLTKEDILGFDDGVQLHSPSPADGTTDVSTTPTLAWQVSNASSTPLTFEVYLGKLGEPMIIIGHQLSYSYLNVTDTLASDAEYLWQVQTRDSLGHTVSHSVWQFHTAVNDTSGGLDPGDDPPSDSTYGYVITDWVGSYDLGFTAYTPYQMEAGLVAMPDGGFMIVYQQPNTYSPHNTFMISVAPDGEEILNQSALDIIGYVRRYARQSRDGYAMLVGSVVTNGYYHAMHAAWVDANGNVAKSISPTTGFHMFASDLLELDDGYLMTGSSEMGLTPGLNAHVLRLDTSGQIVWQIADSTIEQRGVNLLEDGSGGYYVGITQKSSYSESGCPAVLHVNDDGEELWEYRGTPSSYQLVANMAPHPDGGVALLLIEPILSGDKRSAGYLTIDSEGLLSSHREYEFDADAYEEYPEQIKPLPNGNFLMLVNVKHTDSQYFMLREIDPYGDEVWAKRYLEGYDSFANAMVVNPDGTVTVLALVKQVENYFGTKFAILKMQMYEGE